MDDIAFELDATKGLLYYHFKTKEELLAAILQQSPMIASLESGLQAVGSMPFAQAMRLAVHGSLILLESNRDFVRFLHVQALLSGEEAEVVYREVIDRLAKRIEEGIDQYRATGEVRPETNSKHWARMTISLVTSYFLEIQVFGATRKPDPEYIDHMIETLVNAVATGNPPSNQTPR